MRSSILGIAAATVLVLTTTTAGALIWATATDPLGLVRSAASDGVWAALFTAAGRTLAQLW